jgi:hypothetical protein
MMPLATVKVEDFLWTTSAHYFAMCRYDIIEKEES